MISTEQAKEIIVKYGQTLISNHEKTNYRTDPIEISVDQLIELISSADVQNIDYLTGISYIISPYLLYNQNEEITSKLELICSNIIPILPYATSFPLIYGIVESLYQITIKMHFIPDCILEYISNEMENNLILKTYIICSLYDNISKEFFENNTNTIYQIVINTFDEVNTSMKCNLILLLSEINLSINELNPLNEFGSKLCNFAFELCCSNNDEYCTLITPLQNLMNTLPEFFMVDNMNFSSIIESLSSDISCYVSLLRLLSFLNENCLSIFYSKAIEYMESLLMNEGFIPKELMHAIKDSTELEFTDEQKAFMSEILLGLVKENQNDTALLLLAFYSDNLGEFVPDSTSFIFRCIMRRVLVHDSNKFCLFSAIAYNANSFITFGKIIVDKILPTLINYLEIPTSNASKALIKLIKANIIACKHELDVFYQQFNTINHDTYFKILRTLIAESEPKDLVDVINLVAQLLDNEQIDIRFAARVLEVCNVLDYIDNELINNFVDRCTDIAYFIINGDDSFGFPIAAEYLFQVAKSIKDESMYQRLLMISNGSIQCEKPEEQILTSLYTSCLAEQYNYSFPIEIVNSFLQKGERYQVEAMIIMKHIYDTQPNDVINAFSAALPLILTTTSSQFVNHAFITAIYILEKNDKPIDAIDSILWTTLQGRIEILSHNFPNDYDWKGFKLYKFIRKYIKTFPSKSQQIISVLIDWLPTIANDSLPKLIKPILSAIAQKHLSDSQLSNCWNFMLDRLKIDWDNNDTLQSLLACLVTIHEFYPQKSNFSDIHAILQFVWEESEEDEEVIELVAPILIFVYQLQDTNTDIYIDSTLFHKIVQLMIEKQYDWDYKDIIMNIVNLYEKRGTKLDFQIEIAEVLIHFLILNEIEEERIFDENDVNNICKVIHDCISVDPHTKDYILHKYSKSPAKLSIVNEIID